MKRHIITIDSNKSSEELVDMLASLGCFKKLGKTALEYREPEPLRPLPISTEVLEELPCEDHKWVENTKEDGNRVVECGNCGEDKYQS